MFNVTQITFIVEIVPYPLIIKTLIGVNREDTTMTSFHRLSVLKAITLSAALSMTAGLALAGDNNVSANQIINALQPKPLTRGLSVGPQADRTAANMINLSCTHRDLGHSAREGTVS